MVAPRPTAIVAAVLNGKPIGRLDTQNGTHDYTLALPAQQAAEPVDELILHWSKMLNGNWENRLDPNPFYPGSVVVKSAGVST